MRLIRWGPTSRVLAVLCTRQCCRLSGEIRRQTLPRMLRAVTKGYRCHCHALVWLGCGVLLSAYGLSESPVRSQQDRPVTCSDLAHMAADYIRRHYGWSEPMSAISRSQTTDCRSQTLERIVDVGGCPSADRSAGLYSTAIPVGIDLDTAGSMCRPWIGKTRATSALGVTTGDVVPGGGGGDGVSPPCETVGCKTHNSARRARGSTLEAAASECAVDAEGRRRMVAVCCGRGWTIEATAARFQVDAKTVRKWRDRFLAEGRRGLVDRSSRPHRSPNRTPRRLRRRVVRLRQRRRWGADHIGFEVGLAASTVQSILTGGAGPPGSR